MLARHLEEGRGAPLARSSSVRPSYFYTASAWPRFRECGSVAGGYAGRHGAPSGQAGAYPLAAV
eukprot:207901-Prymnesium_polylepis.3